MRTETKEFYISSLEQLDSFLFNTDFNVVDILNKPDHWVLTGFFTY